MAMLNLSDHFFLSIPPDLSAERADKALAELMPEHTRSAIQSWMKAGLIMRDGVALKPAQKLILGDRISIKIPPPALQTLAPQDIPLDILHEDSEILIINKPAGLIVHPGAGNPDGTLLNALLFHFPQTAELPRAGIVHRLDKGTSGAMVVAKTEHARQALIAQLENRSMHRQYLSVIEGIMIGGQTINQPIGRHQHDRLKMAVIPSGKTAITHIKVLEKYQRHCLIQANLETGRTHQIRVHLKHVGHTIVGDRTYGNRNHIPPRASEPLRQAIGRYAHPALHASHLSLRHPRENETVSYECPPPSDLAKLIQLLRADHEADLL